MNQKLISVMLFYALLTYLLAPYVGYLMGGNKHISTGFVAGSVLSIALWYSYGQSYSMSK